MGYTYGQKQPAILLQYYLKVSTLSPILSDEHKLAFAAVKFPPVESGLEFKLTKRKKRTLEKYCSLATEEANDLSLRVIEDAANKSEAAR